ncbi:MAG: glycosyltransferase [Bacteroidia bacterium]
METVALIFALLMLLYAAFVFRAAWYFARQACPPPAQAVYPSVSVVIPARNEAAHLAHCLGTVLHQDYPGDRYEVILVNDHSTDATLPIAWAMTDRHPRLRVLNLAEEGINAYKKAALAAGIAAARGEIIVQTDADCEVGPDWLRTMVGHFGPRTGLVSGPVQLLYEDTWLGRFQALESMGLVALGAGSMAAGRPNMCNGANLAYRRAAFEDAGGFGTDAVASGDDELLLQRIRRLGTYDLRFAKCREAVVTTRTQPDWASLKAQRLRWVSKVRAYLDRRINVVQLVSYLAFWGFPVLLVLGLYDSSYLLLLGELFLLKVAVDFVLMYQAARFFHTFRLLNDFLPLQLAYIPYVLWIGLAGNLTRRYTWKGRSVS